MDTNLLVRFLVRDDEAQAKAAEAVLASACYAPASVLLETVWLLSSRYRVPRADIADSIDDIAALPGMSVDDFDGLGWAVDRFRRGADFADMLHLISTRNAAEAFVTFDRRLVRQAGAEPPLPVETVGA